MTKIKFPTDEELRTRGYMNPEEFVDRIVPGLKAYLVRNLGEDTLSHPEDLIGNVLSYIEVAYFVVEGLGANKK